MGLALVMNGRHDAGVRMLEAVAADPAATDTSHYNLQLAYGMVTAAKVDAEASAFEQADGGIAQESVAPVAVEPVMVEMDSPTKPAPEPAVGGNLPILLIPGKESERPYATTGELEIPIEVTVREDSASAGPSGDSPLRMQTARATTGVAVDANLASGVAPSAYLGAYLTTDAGIAAPKDTASAAKAARSQVAAMQMTAPAAPTLPGDGYAVQLASYRSEGRAMLGWSELRGNAPDLLDPVSPVVQRADLGEDRGVVYRLRTAPAVKNDATALCTELKARDIDCMVVKEVPSEAPSGSRAG
jgi:hypothetical protein